MVLSTEEIEALAQCVQIAINEAGRGEVTDTAEDAIEKLKAAQQGVHPPPLTVCGMQVEIANWLNPGQWFIRPSAHR